MSSINVAGNTSGSVTIQAPAVSGSTTLTLPVVNGTLLSTASGQVLTAPVLGTPASGSLENCTGVQYTGFKNRIINGNMAIDQRNAGASVTPNNSYTLDRWSGGNNQTGKFTVQQNANSVTLPVGFTNYLGVVSSSAYAIISTDFFAINQPIEGYNVADLGWGTANAKTITLSFLVQSSLTGTFGGVLKNSNGTRSYPFTYSIPVANTWTQISITIVGDTTGNWLTNNGAGISLSFGLGVGATYSGTAGSWAAANYVSATGATSVVGTSGATFYITGVQLEKGSTATSFDYRPYGTELSLCERYYQGDILATVGGGAGPTATNRSFYCNVNFPVPFRASPTMTTLSTIVSSNMNAGSWAQLDASRGYFVATNSVTNDCALVVQCSGAAEL
jgi:hypothetical protein